MKPRRKPLSKRLGSALVMTLVIIVLITVVTVGYLASVMLETKTAGSSLDQERAYGIAVVGAHEAMARIREALGPWDDPYKNFATNTTNYYWSLSPGRITRWSYTNANPLTNIALFSASSTTNLVNLNRQLADGSYPIIGGATPPEVPVKWANLLRDPSNPPGADNPIVGRYAFWVDDEGAKINVNTADGTDKYTTNSLGIGTPSEVSLGLLFGGTNGTLTKQVVQMARTNGFSSPRDILRAGVTNTVLADNVFSLTAYSRSPELNVFGQPRVSVAPMLGDGGWQSGNMLLNSLTLLPAREIYPTPSQLPGFTINSPWDVDHVARTNNPWPLALRGEMGAYSTGTGEADFRTILRYAPSSSKNYSHNQGFLLANYLAGTNAASQQIQWPRFPGSSAQGFAGKYTKRQMDSIVAQILSIGSKAISSDYPYTSGYVGEQIGHRYMVAPYVFPGWLSQQWVIGVGRSPKVTQMYMEVRTFPSVGTWSEASPTNYTPPQATFDIWLEWWMPTGYFGGKKSLDLKASRYFVGHRKAKSTLNVIDFPRNLEGNEFNAPLPRVADTNSSAIYAYWANQLLRSYQGLDFAGNPSVVEGSVTQDHDQELAKNFHDPFARINPATNNIGNYKGTAGPTILDSGTFHYYASPFFLTYLEPDDSPSQEWQQGEMRSIRSLLGTSYRMSMQTNAVGLKLEGGLAVKTQFKDGHFTDPDPVPLEAVRGAHIKDGVTTQEPFPDQETDAVMDVNWTTVPAVPNDPSQGNLRDRVRVSVVPVNLEMSIGEVRHVMITLRGPRRDPLVNKFPGDWESVSGTLLATTIQPSASVAIPNGYPDTAFRSTLTDPESYWMPQADAGLCASIAQVADQTQIPRSARMPNIGYLQYVRTGIIPDDESGSYSAQHGTPFRLLSYAPSTEPTSGDPLVGQETTRSGSESYPDWAMLDLFYIPSTLAAFGSIYNPAVPNPSTNSAVTNLLYYGTYGGATAGKINPNGAVIYTTNADVPQANVSRTLPLQAVLDGVQVNQTITGSGTNARFTNGTAVAATTIAQAIENYIRTNAPLRMPAEICNVPEIAALRAANNPTRNDLVRQVVGALTTQGNVFSVWTVGQAVKKKPAHTEYGEFESGDNVLAEVRLRFIVERYLDPGADNVYGNTGTPGPDGIIGTYDDPVDSSNHPFEPRYLYRVLASEEIR